MVRPADGAQNRREKRGATRDAASRRAPRARGREATEALLRDAALRLLDREGVLAGISLQDVADEAGLSRGLIDHYFGSRQALLRSALEARRRAAVEEFERRRHSTPEERFTWFWRVGLRGSPWRAVGPFLGSPRAPQTVVSDGLSLHVEVDGPDDGPVAVLVHGFAGSVELAWRATGVLDRLTSLGVGTVAYDARGHGRSDKPPAEAAYGDDRMADDLIRVADAHHADLVVGYSMGAAVALHALAAGLRCRGAVIGAALQPSSPGRPTWTPPGPRPSAPCEPRTKATTSCDPGSPSSRRSARTARPSPACSPGTARSSIAGSGSRYPEAILGHRSEDGAGRAAQGDAAVEPGHPLADQVGPDGGGGHGRVGGGGGGGQA
jgi:pimeloyl-ACP methyl ester carboxylesterase